MVSVMSLLLPVLLSAVLVFILSSIVHTVLGYHSNDYGPVPDEDAVRAALRLPPGDYVVPHASGMAEMKKTEYTAKVDEGPVAFISVAKPGSSFMGTSLALWFIYCVVVSIFAAYVSSRALATGADYLDVFRFAGTVAFAGYGLGIWQQHIWYRRSAGSTLKSTFDALLYACVTAGTLGWLWPG